MKRLTASIILILFLSTYASAAWLSGYSNRKKIPITAANPSAISVACEYDSYMQEGDGNADANFGTATSIYINTDNDISNRLRGIMTFSVNNTVTSASLHLYYNGYVGLNDPVGKQVDIWKCTRNFVETQATWNIYSTGNNWSAAGGDYDSDGTPAGANFNVPAAAGEVTVDITAIVNDAVTNNNGRINILLRYNDETDDNYYVANFASSEAGSNTPHLVYTPAVNTNYKVPIDVYRDAPTVQTGTWTVNSKTYNYRIPFAVQAYSAISSVHAKMMLVDTASLVTCGAFASSTASNAYSVEFADSAGNNCLKYWVQSTFGTPIRFNTASTPYWIGYNGLTANTGYTYYMYVDPDNTSESSNHDPKSVFAFFEDFETDAANLSAFLTAYTDWEQDTTNAPVVAVSSGSLTLDNAAGSEWRGIKVKASVLNIKNWRMWWRAGGSDMGLSTLVGMVNSTGVDALQDGIVYQYESDSDYVCYKAGVANKIAFLGSPYATYGPCYETSCYGGDSQLLSYRGNILDLGDGIPPDITTHNPIYAATTASKDMTAAIASYATNTVSVDWIAVSTEVEKPPVVLFPDITYTRNGAAFLDGKNAHWPYDIMFTQSDGTTQLYYNRDNDAELMKKPNRSERVNVRMGENLGSNRDVYLYYNNSTVTTDHAYMSKASTYNDSIDDYLSMATTTGITEISGTWVKDTVPEAMITKGEVRNAMGSAGGRLWGRFPNVVKWDTNDYRMIFNSATWEYSSAGWPAMFNTYYCTATTPNGPWSSPILMDELPELYSHWPCQFKKWDSTAYLIETRQDVAGFEVLSGTDIENLTRNTNGPFFGKGWMATHDGGGSNLDSAYSAMSMAFTKVGSTYYIAIASFVNSAGANFVGLDGQVAFWSTTDAPENWDSDSFTYLGKKDITGAARYIEDIDLHYDSGTSTWYLYHFKGTGSPTYTLNYNTCAAAQFPAGTWGTDSSLTISKLPPMVDKLGMTSPRLLIDGSDYWMYFSGYGYENASYAQTMWSPNYIYGMKSSSYAGTYTIQSTDDKYKVSDSASRTYSYITDTNYVDGEIKCEVQLDNDYDAGGTDTCYGGVTFRQDTAGTGYAALVCYNASTHRATVGLYKTTSSAYTAVGTPYTMPLYPIPDYSPGFKIKLRIRAVGTAIKIHYSLWGNDWVSAVDTTDTTYTSGKYGMTALLGDCWFNDLTMTQYVTTAPIVGTGTAESGANAVLFLGPGF